MAEKKRVVLRAEDVAKDQRRAVEELAQQILASARDDVMQDEAALLQRLELLRTGSRLHPGGPVLNRNRCLVEMWKSREALTAKTVAWEWFFAPFEGLRPRISLEDVCSVLGLDPERVRDEVEKLAPDPPQWRIEEEARNRLMDEQLRCEPCDERNESEPIRDDFDALAVAFRQRLAG